VATLAPGGVVTCPACGGELHDTRAVPLRTRHAPTLARERWVTRAAAAPDRLVRAFVTELLLWDRAVASVERAARGGASPLAGCLQAAELGVLGTGCRGTKGVGHAPTPEPSSLPVDPRASARYQGLPRPDRETADAVVSDGQGDALVRVPFGARTLECTLAQRLGLRLADTAQQLRWHTHLVAGDSPPALAGAERLGQERLERAARAWLGLAVPDLARGAQESGR
jgi:hypothetical protein